MHPIPTLKLSDSLRGFLFDSMSKGGVCFVPCECVRLEPGRGLVVDHAPYLMSGWARRNKFLNPSLPGDRLFPNDSADVRDFTAPAAASFLGRIRQLGYSVTTIS